MGELDGKHVADVVCLQHYVGGRTDEVREMRKPAVIAILLGQLSDETFGCAGECVGPRHRLT